MHIDQAHLGLHQHTGYSRVRTGCSTPRWTIQYVSMPDGRFRANPPLPLVVWAICAALSAVAIHRGGHRGINEANFSQSGDDYKFFTKQKKKKKKKIQAVQSELQPASSTPLACYLKRASGITERGCTASSSTPLPFRHHAIPRSTRQPFRIGGSIRFTRGAKKSTAELLEPALLEPFSLGKSNLRSTEHRCSRACSAFSVAEACRPSGLSIASRANSTAASLDENGKLESKGLKAFR